MTAKLLYGAELAKALRHQIHERVEKLAHDHGVVPTLRLVVIGEDPATNIYAQRLQKAGDAVEISVTVDRYDGSITESELGLVVAALNDEPAPDGVVFGMPLPSGLTAGSISARLNPARDVDGITIASAGRLYMGLPGHVASTAAAILYLLKTNEIPLSGRRAVVVGRSNVVGKPVGILLLREHATVTYAHSRTANLRAVTRQADILVVAAGKAGLITGSMVKPGAVVIDAGINPAADGIVGDVDFESVERVAGAITPVPGGVGPLTNVMILRQVAANAERRATRE